MKRIWQVAPEGRTIPSTASELQSLLLRQRGLDDAAAEAFFNPKYDRDIHDPQTLAQVPKAVERIYKAVKNKEQIVVYGDYDADGVSSTAILVTVLRQLGAQVTPYLPHRVDDGYGLNAGVLDRLAPDLDLLITVDCGISNYSEIAALKKQKIDSIILDHHEPPKKLPPAVAIVHPRHPKGEYAEPWLCGAGVAWKVAQALLRDPRSGVSDDPDIEKWLLDLAVLGTIADVVPLLGENRAIVRFGLEVLKRTKRPGLRALLTAARVNAQSLSATDIAFRVIPRLNAAGRMDHPQPALDILLATTDIEAEIALHELERLNSLRQQVTKKIIKEAEAQVNPEYPVIFVHSISWPSGVVGLAAGRLADKWQRPAIVVGAAGTALVGSARSPVGSHVLDVLRIGEQHLEKLGGHAQAAGFTVKAGQVEALAMVLQTQITTTTEVIDQPQVITASTYLPHNLLEQSTIDMLQNFRPWGEANAEPAFIVTGLQLLHWRPVGKEQKHIKFTFGGEYDQWDGIGFNIGEQVTEELPTGRHAVDIVCHLQENDYRGRRSVQLAILDIVPAGSATITG